MDTLNRFFICLLWVMFVMPQAMAQQTDAKKIMEEVEAGFRKAGGLRIGFSMQASSGQSSGTIELKDEKFVLYAGGGILSSSQVEDEWQETEKKMGTMRFVVHHGYAK